VSFVLAGFACMASANAQTNPACPYTLASIQGTYGIVVNYGANVAMALGARTYDGNGNMTGTFIINALAAGSTTGARTISHGTQTGTYTVTCNGTGVITRVVTLTTGATALDLDDFVITAAARSAQAGQPLLATTLVDAGEDPSTLAVGGLFVTRVQTRLPDLIPLFGF
jgi:hypothetical protein